MSLKTESDVDQPVAEAARQPAQEHVRQENSRKSWGKRAGRFLAAAMLATAVAIFYTLLVLMAIVS
jgi:hypothetical protein